jgi:hypothetical protein
LTQDVNATSRAEAIAELVGRRQAARMRRIAVSAAALASLLSASCTDPPPKQQGPVWSPGVVYPSERQDFRGFLDVRGLVHAHSVYSHDACDGEPVDENGVRDPVCFDDFRRGLCQSKHDFVFLTDHRESYDATEYPENLLYREERGDELVIHDGNPTASFAACDDGSRALIMAGNEGGMMPVGVETHVAPPGPERTDLLGQRTPEAAQALHDHGAVVLLAHPEDFTVDELKTMPVDGFEMYNLHANTLLAAGTALDLLVRARDGDTVPHPDLLVLALWSEDPRYLQRWGNVLASGKHLTTTMGTDCHRNTFTTILEDGERADSYRRMMISFSNHLRIRPNADGTFDDRTLKEALAAGRNWGAFEMMGYPVGFDAFATKGSTDYEMGDTVPVGAQLVVKMPKVKDLDPAREAPALRIRILKATDDEAGFSVVAEGDDDEVTATLAEPGAYRAEVRMLPLHLREDLRLDAFTLLDALKDEGRDYVWIYTGAFYAE